MSAGNPTVVGVSHGEVGHIHHFDGSKHIILIPSDTKSIIEAGWGELHSPRDSRELAVTRRILEAAVRYARHVAR